MIAKIWSMVFANGWFVSAGTVAASLILTAPAASQARVDSPRQSGSQPSEVRTDAGNEGFQAVGGDRLLDGPVNRSDYRLGPGDVVVVSIFGEVSRTFRVPVTPEGSIILPNLGTVDLLDLDLDRAQVRVRELVSRYYRAVDVRLNLGEIRTFKVFVVGGVEFPGVRTATSATRVSEVLASDNRDGIIHRNVEVQRRGGEVVPVDLARFVRTGDLSHNPPLRDGDIIVVPIIDQTVRVYGRVSFPGTYEHRSGETLAQLMSLVNGGAQFPSNAADTILITRFTNSVEREHFAFSQAEARGLPGEAFTLRAFDAVYVPEVSNFMRQRIATVVGEVVRPGAYPIVPDVTTVEQLVEMAGGFTREASLLEATLRRQPRFVLETPASEDAPPEFLTPEERQVLHITSRGDETNVVINFRDIFSRGGEGATNQPLQDGDVLHVPQHRNEVVVLGAVVDPGIVPHRSGYTVDDFIRIAGGYSRNADRGAIMILKAKLGTRLSARDVTSVDPGDRIVVPYKARRTTLDRLQMAQAAATTVTALVFTIVTIANLF